MLNIKNIFVISFSAILASVIALGIQKYASLEGLPVFLICSFIAGIFTLIIQNFINAPKNNVKSNVKSNAKKKSKASAQSKTTTVKGKREDGTVKWFDSNKGYGFITRSMGEDIFVHFRSIRGNGYRSLHEGQAVEFVVTDGDKGPQAEDIHVIKS